MAVVGLAAATTSQTMAATFRGLGDLPGRGYYSVATAVSPNGDVVVGASESAFGPEAFRWTLSEGMQGLGDLPGGDFFSGAFDVSSNGVIVGRSDSGRNGFYEAFRWTRAAGMEALGDFGEGIGSNASGVSEDGTIIVGDTGREAFRWTAQGGLQLLEGRHYGFPELEGSTVNAVSADGSTTVGNVWGLSPSEASRWTATGQRQGLGSLPSGYSSNAYGVSRNGEVVVGIAQSSPDDEAFRWTQQTGMQGLGRLAGYSGSGALDVSDDGSVVIGYASDGYVLTERAFIWDKTNGPRFLQDVLARDWGINLDGWKLGIATGISSDGNVIVGTGHNPAGQEEGWIADLRQHVVLKWGQPVPIAAGIDASGNVYIESGEMLPQIPSAEFQAAVLHEVRQIFARSGVKNVSFGVSDVPQATDVYFAESIHPNLLGFARGEADHRNSRSDDDAVVFVQRTAVETAVVVTHEVGHTLGLMHVSPGILPEPFSNEVMDGFAGSNERFINSVSRITDDDESRTHNPLYHLKRYVDGESDQSLQAAGILPGEWDLLPPQQMHSSFEMGALSQAIYDVEMFLSTGNGDTLVLMDHYDVISKGASLEKDFIVSEGSRLRLVASSSPGGPRDIVITTVESNAAPGSGAPLVTGHVSINVQLHDDSVDNFVSIGAGGVNSTLLGDANGDSFVDASDLSVVIAHYGANTLAGFSNGDFNGDGLVGVSDLLEWQRNSRMSGDSTATAVPEPKRLTLPLLASIMGVVAWGRRRRGIAIRAAGTPASSLTNDCSYLAL